MPESDEYWLRLWNEAISANMETDDRLDWEAPAKAAAAYLREAIERDFVRRDSVQPGWPVPKLTSGSIAAYTTGTLWNSGGSDGK